MTFTELDTALGETGRRSLATRLVFSLADALDSGRVGLDLDEFEQQSGYVRTNIRTVASALKKLGVIDIQYYDDNSTVNDRFSEQNIPRGRWSKQQYRLAEPVRSLFRR